MGRIMRIAVCEDESVVREDIVKLIQKYQPDADVSAFASGEELLEAGMQYDIVFLDILFDDRMSGIQTARSIREKQENDENRKSIIVFITGYREYMEEAFDVNAFHYLLKPVSEDRFAQVLDRAWKEQSAADLRDRQYILFKSANMQQKIFLKDIDYIESANKKVLVHTSGGVTEGYGKMERLEAELDGYFYRCHRCCLVNMEKISAYSTDIIQLLSGEKLVLARKKYPDFLKHYMDYARSGGIVNV